MRGGVSTADSARSRPPPVRGAGETAAEEEGGGERRGNGASPGRERRALGTRTRAPHLGCGWISGAFHRDTAAYASLSPGEARESSWISLCGAVLLLGKGTGPGAAGSQRRGAGPPRRQTSQPIAAAPPRPGEGGGPRRHFSGLLRRGRAGFAGKGVGLAGRTSSPRNTSGRLPALPPVGTAPAGAGSRRRDPPSCRQLRPRRFTGGETDGGSRCSHRSFLRRSVVARIPAGREAARRPCRPPRGCSPRMLCGARQARSAAIFPAPSTAGKAPRAGGSEWPFLGLPAWQKPRDLQRGWEEDTPLVLSHQ